MDVLEALRTRRSIGKLGGDVSPQDVRTIVEAALYAPNHKLTEPWRFTVLRGDARVRLGEAWSKRLAARTHETDADRDAYLRREAQRPLRAPVLIVVSTRTSDDAEVALEDYAATAAAVQNMLLAAHALGLGAIWRTGAMAYDASVGAFLGLDPSDRIVAIVYLGRSAMDPPRPRAHDVATALRELE